MSFSITTWNINSVRLRIEQVTRFLAEHEPDVLCLQETKCPNAQFPSAALRALGYQHIALNGQKGYHGVAIVSRIPFADVEMRRFCDKDDSRHITVELAGTGAAGGPKGRAKGVRIHNFYVPAGGDIPDPEINPRFAHKLAFLNELGEWNESERPAGRPSILVGDLNIAPYETDVWNHKALLGVVSHTPVETEGLEAFRRTSGYVDAVRTLTPEPEKVFTWWSYRSPDWSAADKGRRLDHVWLAPDLAPALTASAVARDVRGWERPSDHAPVTVTLDL
ncbi:MAG: exodeoxyribonuclease III [Pseudochelatococcus sp.]|uniref:exodeoxyribonuclease III n=1 Tax=Pseudochelatococcus sp. TaxID=2020869 RepID=UPI003D90E34E